MTGLIIVLSGPSGAGKASVAKGSGLEIAPSWTTRPPKSRDQPGEYVYVTEEEFTSGWETNKLLEYDPHFGNLYGLAKPPPNKVLITDIDVNGALKLKEMPNVVLIGVLPPDPITETCLSRLRKRGDESDLEILDREDRIRYESELILSQWPKIIRNESLLEARRQLKTIIANSCRARGITLP